MLIQCAILAKQKSNNDVCFVPTDVKNLYHKFCKAKYRKKLIPIFDDGDTSLCHGCYKHGNTDVNADAASWVG
jgi:hypothetical protein